MTTMGSPRLERFREAQDAPDAGFDCALAEVRSGGKRGHWMWYVFPQLNGLGQSFFSQRYAIRDVTEAEAFLRDGLLRHRLLSITTAVAEQARGHGMPLNELMGSSIDTLKLVSSLTLFGTIARRLYAAEGLDEHARLAGMVDEVLAAAERDGYLPCQYTLRRLEVWDSHRGSAPPDGL